MFAKIRHVGKSRTPGIIFQSQKQNLHLDHNLQKFDQQKSQQQNLNQQANADLKAKNKGISVPFSLINRNSYIDDYEIEYINGYIPTKLFGITK